MPSILLSQHNPCLNHIALGTLNAGTHQHHWSMEHGGDMRMTRLWINNNSFHRNSEDAGRLYSTTSIHQCAIMTLNSTVWHVDNFVVCLLCLSFHLSIHLHSIHQLLQVATFLFNLAWTITLQNRAVSIRLRRSTQSPNISQNVRPVDPRSDCARWYSSCQNMCQHDCASHSLSSYWCL